MNLNAILTGNNDYERRLCQALGRGAKIDRWWVVAIGMKLEHDRFKSHVPIEEENMSKEDFLLLMEKTFKDVCGDSFESFNKHKINGNDKDWDFYKISLTNFSVIVSIYYRKNGLMLHSFDSYYSIEFFLNMSIKEFAQWMYEENQEMPAFRQDWEEHLKEMRKRNLLGKVDVSAVKALIVDRLSEKAQDCQVISNFTNEGGYLEVSCPSPEVCFRLPITYTNWQEVISLFTDVVKSQSK